MWAKLRNIKEKLGIPSGRAILHIIIVEIIINWGWNEISKMFRIPVIREIGFLAVFVAGLFVVAWYLPKLTPNLTGASQSFLRSRNKEHNGYDVESIRYGNVLRQMMNEDIDKPEDCLLVEFRRAKVDHIGDIAGPYFDFEFWIYSSSINKMQFNKEPSGHIVYEGQQLKDEPEFVPGSWVSLKPSLLRKQSGTIELRQFLLPQIASNIMDMSDKKTKRIILNLHQINIPIDMINPKGDIVKTWRCPLPDVSFLLPADGSIAYPR